MTNYIKFHFKTDHKGSSIPYIYGSLPELGNGNAARGIELKPLESVYNYIAEIRVKQPRNPEDNNWYSYCYRPRFGAIVYETGPKRYLPKISSSSGSIIDIYDTSDSVLSVCELTVRFRVKCHTNFGEELFIVGDCKELGNWQTKCAQQLFYEAESDSWVGDICFPLTSSSRTIQYKYFKSNDSQEAQWEPEENHIIHLDSVTSPAFVEVSDTFRWNDPILNTFTRSAFTEVITKRKYPVAPPRISPNSVNPGEVSVNFSVMCPYVKRNQALAIVGSCQELGKWNPENGLLLADADFPLWTGAVTLKRSSLPFEYKYVIYDQKNEVHEIHEGEDKENDASHYIWENCENRVCRGVTGEFVDITFPATVIISDWYVSPNANLFKGMGIHCPLFSVRTQESCGVGQYSDIRRLVDLCKLIGSTMIELLPLNDTNGPPNCIDARNSSPYNIISSFALNPIYINLLEILPNLPSDIYGEITSRKFQLEQRREVDYSDVYRFKMATLRKIFEISKDLRNRSSDFDEFCTFNEEWLNPYSLFCVLCNEQGTSEFWKWNLKVNGTTVRHIATEEINRLSRERSEETEFIKWVQYIADRQLRASAEYASSSGVILKADVPFGVQRNSADCWSNQRLFDINASEGSVPSERDPEGENYGYAAFNWKAMKADNFSWWRLRMKRLSDLFQSVHIDHIESFFRAWLIHNCDAESISDSVSIFENIMGRFSPSVCVTKQELEQRGLWDIERYVRPYVRFHILREKFDSEAESVANNFFVPRRINGQDDFYDFKESCNTPEKLEEILNRTIHDLPKRNHYRTCLLQLLSNVILIPESSQDQQNIFRFRSNITIEHVESNGAVFPSSSFNELDVHQKQSILELYNEFLFGRQSELWLREGVPKLEMLDKSSKMLIFGEYGVDYGDLFERESEYKSIVQLHNGLRSNQSYESSSSFSYMTQCQPSLPTSSTIRAWWEENKDAAFNFWKDELKQNPNQFNQYCMCDVLTKILQYNLNSQSMWCVFLLQDVVNTFDCLRREYPNEERIFKVNQFKNGNLYRFPWSLEELINYNEWTNYVRNLVQEAKRK